MLAWIDGVVETQWKMKVYWRRRTLRTTAKENHGELRSVMNNYWELSKLKSQELSQACYDQLGYIPVVLCRLVPFRLKVSAC